MTHTLHPEILEAIKVLANDILDPFIQKGIQLEDIKPKFMEIVADRLKPYLHMPTDLKDIKPLPEITLLGKDDISDGDMGCEIYGWVSDGKVIITGVIYKPKEEQKQSSEWKAKLIDFINTL